MSCAPWGDMKVALPRLENSVAPCFEYSATFVVFTIEEGQVISQVDFPLQSREPMDRVRLLRDQEIDTVICGGVGEKYEELLRASGIRVISWVTGSVEDLLRMFLRGQLVPGS